MFVDGDAKDTVLKANTDSEEVANRKRKYSNNLNLEMRRKVETDKSKLIERRQFYLNILSYI